MTFSTATRAHRGAAWAALVGLFLQIVLSLGHVHFDDLASGGFPGRTGGGEHSVSAPAHGTTDHETTLAADLCPICMAAALLGSGALPDPVRLDRRPVRGTAAPGLVAPRLVFAERFEPQQTRAPPASDRA